MWRRSGRRGWIRELVRFQDRGGRELVLSPTHEEAFVEVVRAALSSYRDLPLLLYQFQIKFRDEERTKDGLSRTKEIFMHDGYSFHRSYHELNNFFPRLFKAFRRIFERCGIQTFAAEAGVGYIGDWVYDDEPTVIKTTNGPLVTLPYTIECNDIPVMIVQHHNSDYLLKLVTDQFDRLYAESATRAKFVALAIHPYISGQPHRIKYLEQIYDYVNKHEGVLHWNGAQILDWYRGVAKI